MFGGLIQGWQEFLPHAPTYLPLGIIGGWRWGVWLLKKFIAQFYKPVKTLYHTTVSVVTPVYNEDPEIFAKALNSWRNSGVNEIVAVIDHTDEKCLQIFRDFARQFTGAKLIVTDEPGKRPALVKGSLAASGEVVALVDSDTLWESDVREKCLRPFSNFQIGGVTMRQVVHKPRTLAQHLYNMQQNTRFLDEYPFLTALDGSTVHCLSGRTAFYRKTALLPALPGLANETFLGKKVISGDDKRLTYLVEQNGWKVAYQKDARVHMQGEPNLFIFLKQRLRWARNSWRADMRALTQSWTWKKPYFALYLLDRLVQPFTLLMGPIYFVWSLILGVWLPALALLAWWHFSRMIRLWSHLKYAPEDVFLIPLYILFNFYSGIVRIYALVTLNRQGWITRWHNSRLPQLKWIATIPSFAVTIMILTLMSGMVFIYEIEDKMTAKNQAQEIIHQAKEAEIHSAKYSLSADIPSGNANIVYNANTNTIYITGERAVVSLADINQAVGSSYLVQEKPGQWFLAANLTINRSIQLDLSGAQSVRLGVDNISGNQVRIYEAPYK